MNFIVSLLLSLGLISAPGTVSNNKSGSQFTPLSNNSNLILVAPTYPDHQKSLQLQTFWFVTPTVPVVAAASSSVPGDCGYPIASSNPRTSIGFNESEVLRAYSPAPGKIAGPSDAVILWYNDEHAMQIGIRKVNVITSTGMQTTSFAVSEMTNHPYDSVLNPLTGAPVSNDDYSGVDTAGRPIAPSLFLTDITNDANSRSGDWQYNGTAISPSAIFGTWKSTEKIVDKTKSTDQLSYKEEANPEPNEWQLGTGADPVPLGLKNEGYGAEARWDVAKLGLTAGHTYRAQFIVHDGDQSKTGGDVGMGCATVRT